MELATSTPNNLVSSSSFSPSDHLKQSDPENVQFDSMIQSEPSVAQSELQATILISDGTKGIFVGYPLDQPLCYKVSICGPPHQLKISTHVNFVSNNYLPRNILQVSSTANALWSEDPFSRVEVSASNKNQINVAESSSVEEFQSNNLLEFNVADSSFKDDYQSSNIQDRIFTNSNPNDVNRNVLSDDYKSDNLNISESLALQPKDLSVSNITPDVPLLGMTGHHSEQMNFSEIRNNVILYRFICSCPWIGK